MIGTITLNPCIDKTVIIDGFHYGGMNRVNSKRADVSGKGINVSIVLKQLSADVRTLGFQYENGYHALVKGLDKLGIDYEGVTVEGTLRENVKVMDMQTSITTELNQKGDFVDTDKILEFEQMLERCLDALDILVVTGSVPQGVPDDYYHKLIKKAKEKGVRTVLDAEGELLQQGLMAKPYLIKPNLFEFETAFGLKSREHAEILTICRKLIADGVTVVCLSMGGEGAMIVDEKEAYLCRPTKIDVKSTQGAGDSLVAGMCIAMEEGLAIDEMLRYGVSAAQGSLIREGTLLCLREDFDYFKKVIKIDKI